MVWLLLFDQTARKRYFVSVGGVIERMDLPSRVFSTGTLMAGVDLVNEETGMDTLNDKSDEDLQRELAELETLLQACCVL